MADDCSQKRAAFAVRHCPFNLIMVNASANADERGTLRNWDSEDAAAAL